MPASRLLAGSGLLFFKQEKANECSDRSGFVAVARSDYKTATRRETLHGASKIDFQSAIEHDAHVALFTPIGFGELRLQFENTQGLPPPVQRFIPRARLRIDLRNVREVYFMRCAHRASITYGPWRPGALFSHARTVDGCHRRCYVYLSLYGLSPHRSILLRIVYGRRSFARERRASCRHPARLASRLRTSHWATRYSDSESRFSCPRPSDGAHSRRDRDAVLTSYGSRLSRRGRTS